MDTIFGTEIQALSNEIANRQKPCVLRHEGGHFLVTHHDQTSTDITKDVLKRRARPQSASGIVELYDALSLVNYVRRFQNVSGGQPDADGANSYFSAGTPAIFADRDKMKFVAVMNYHGEDLPGWGNWRAVYALKASLTLKAWMDLANKGFVPMGDFATFIEDNFTDVHPAPIGENALAVSARAFAAKLGTTYAQPFEILAVARDLEINESSIVKSSARQQDGTVNLQFTTEHRDGTGAIVKVPKLFSIAVPVFEGGDLHFLPVLLQYRIVSGTIKFGIKLPTFDRAKQEAFDELTRKIEVMLIEEGDVFQEEFGSPILELLGEQSLAPIFRGAEPPVSA